MFPPKVSVEISLLRIEYGTLDMTRKNTIPTAKDFFDKYPSPLEYHMVPVLDASRNLANEFHYSKNQV